MKTSSNGRVYLEAYGNGPEPSAYRVVAEWSREVIKESIIGAPQALFWALGEGYRVVPAPKPEEVFAGQR